MIKGFKIDVTTEKLKSYLEQKVTYHTKKAEAYEAKAAALKAEGIQQAGSYDPVLDFETKVRQHRRKAEYFAFVADNLVPDETYRLTKKDFAKIGLVKSDAPFF